MLSRTPPPLHLPGQPGEMGGAHEPLRTDLCKGDGEAPRRNLSRSSFQLQRQCTVSPRNAGGATQTEMGIDGSKVAFSLSWKNASYTSDLPSTGTGEKAPICTTSSCTEAMRHRGFCVERVYHLLKRCSQTAEVFHIALLVHHRRPSLSLTREPSNSHTKLRAQRGSRKRKRISPSISHPSGSVRDAGYASEA